MLLRRRSPAPLFAHELDIAIMTTGRNAACIRVRPSAGRNFSYASSRWTIWLAAHNRPGAGHDHAGIVAMLNMVPADQETEVVSPAFLGFRSGRVSCEGPSTHCNGFCSRWKMSGQQGRHQMRPPRREAHLF